MINLETAFILRCGYKPNLDNPQTYCEKMYWTKLHQRDRRLVMYGSKLGAKQRVHELRLKKIKAVPLLSVDEPPATYPAMVKHNAASGKNKIIYSKEEYLDFVQDIPLFGDKHGEWHYNEMPQVWITEPVLNVRQEIKFYCFDGAIHYLKVPNFKTHQLTWFTSDGKLLPMGFAANRYNPCDPKCKLKNWQPYRKEIEQIAAGFSHVRVDLMFCAEGVFLGEMTFTSHAGLMWFSDPNFDRTLGECWKL